jgi:hypothetical protein
MRTPTGETPFSLNNGTEAVIPVEVGSPSFCVAYYNPRLNDEKAKLHLDLLQKKRDDAQITWAAYQNQTARYFNKLVVPKKFQVEDWVLRKVSLMTKDPTEGKMAPKWEGPYKVVGCHQKGACHLMTETGKMLPRSWNAEHLKKYYM